MTRSLKISRFLLDPPKSERKRAPDRDPDGKIRPGADPEDEYARYIGDVAGGFIPDMGFTLRDFQVYIAGLRQK